MLRYPPGWPRCPQCDDYAMDGHITCGRVECSEGFWRDYNAARYRLATKQALPSDVGILMEGIRRKMRKIG